MTTDWARWHDDYDIAGSSLARRLVVVQGLLRRALAEAPADPDGGRRLLSLCAGDGRDVLPVLGLPVLGGHGGVRAALVERDPGLADRARASAAAYGLNEVEVRIADAGLADTFRDVAPAHVVLACGVFGNVGGEDVERTIAALPAVLAANGLVIWTRGRGAGGADPSLRVRDWFGAHGFAQLAFVRPADARFRVGMHRLAVAPRDARTLPHRLFAFA